MLAALTRIDRHESCFAASKEAPARWIIDRGFPTKGVIAGFDHHNLTLAEAFSAVTADAHPREGHAEDRKAPPGRMRSCRAFCLRAPGGLEAGRCSGGEEASPGGSCKPDRSR
jgi:hypothetical protein